MSFPKALCRCLLTFAVAGIVACGSDQRPAGPDLDAPAAIVLVPDSLHLLVNDTARVRAVVLNVQGDTLADAPITFGSEDTTVAAIDSSGLVHARGGGVSDVSVRSGEVTGVLRVRVRVNGTLVVSPHVVFMQSGDTVQLTVVVRDSNGTVLPSAPVLYRSVDSAVAKVTPAGRVTFGGSAGSVMIQIGSGGRTDGAFITAVVRRIPGAGPQLVRIRGNTAFTLANGFDGATIYRLDLATESLVDMLTIPTGYVDDFTVDHALTHAYLTDDQNGAVLVADLTIDTFIRSIRVAPAYVGPRSVALGPGDSVLFFSADSQLYRLNLRTESSAPVLQCGYRFDGIISNDSMLYGYCRNRVEPYSVLHEYNMRTNTDRVFASGGSSGLLALSSNGQRLYGYDHPALQVWDLLSGDSLASIPLVNGYSGGAIAVQPTTGLLWLFGWQSRIYVVDPSTGHLVRTLQPGGYPWELGFGSSGTGVITNPNSYPGVPWVDIIR